MCGFVYYNILLLHISCLGSTMYFLFSIAFFLVVLEIVTSGNMQVRRVLTLSIVQFGAVYIEVFVRKSFFSLPHLVFGENMCGG